MRHSFRVIQSTGKWYKVASPNGDVIECRLPGKFRLDKKEVTNPVAVGDYVDVVTGSDGTGTITEIYQRENYVPRQATHGRRGEQILVANIDKAWVVQSVRQPKLNTGFIDRFLVTCEAYEVHPGIIINKMDLAKNRDQQFVEHLVELYKEIGYDIVLTSIEDEKSIEHLSEKLRDKTSVFIGPSGAGKTSLLNAVDPGLGLRVGEVSSKTQKGKHTTTFARLVPLKYGGFIADTPGIREFGMVNIEKSELSLFFPEMAEPRNNCKFYNCTHYHEPGCGVSEAYEEGKIDAERYNSYLNILESLD
ncbi:MAG: ribosome small subunit-dependent GTPase A [Balneolaceae bacterium]|nr:MAG: ribosome small subunit-dependent GTPase A [Balneolaceae bacterium]